MYEWLKVLHVLAIISWMAALLYLPRLMVYHVDAPVGSQQSETFKVMERKLLNGIMTPAMLVSWAAGLYLAWAGFGFKGGWLHAKIALVLAMSGMHGFLVGRVRDFAQDRNQRSGRFYRIINEVPAVLMVGIVILVILKPF
jgi:putative membrane protein